MNIAGRWTTQCIPLRGIRNQLLVNITTMKAAKPTQSMVNRIQEKKKHTEVFFFQDRRRRYYGREVTFFFSFRIFVFFLFVRFWKWDCVYLRDLKKESVCGEVKPEARSSMVIKSVDEKP
jgi:hypothetical protein